MITTEGIKRGDIWASVWGYDQTNVDFYKVVDVTRCYINLVQIADKQEPDPASMSGTCTPDLEAPVNIRSAKYRRKVKEFDGKKFVYLGGNYEIAEPWNGEPLAYSTWA